MAADAGCRMNVGDFSSAVQTLRTVSRRKRRGLRPERSQQTGPAGDAQSFGAFIREHDHQLRGVAWAVVRNAHATDDVMQAAYEKAFKALPDFDGRSAMTTWLHSIVYRTALDHVRYEGRRRHDDVDSLRNQSGPRSDAATVGLDRMELAAVLDQLAPQERAAVMLVAGQGYSYDEAAEILGEARGTVAARVSRARGKLERWDL